MARPTQLDADCQSARDRQVRQLALEFLYQRTHSSHLSEEEFLATHASLEPQLSAALDKLRMIAAARRRVESERGKGPPASCRDASVTGDQGSLDSPLTVRCPNCHEPTDVPAESSLLTITCRQCGN